MRMKKIKRKIKKYRWVCILAVSVFFSMYIVGMATIYFPEPIHLGLGQYLDIATGVIIIGFIFAGIAITIIFKKNNRRIGTHEYDKIKNKRGK